MSSQAAVVWAVVVIAGAAVVVLRLRELKGNRPVGAPPADTLPAGTSIRVGQANPEVVPAVLTEQLSRLYATREEVRAAWLGMMENLSTRGGPELVIALDTAADFMALAAESGRVASALPRMEYNLVVVPANDDIGALVKKGHPPFYSRAGA